MAITTWAATTGDWDDSKFDRGWDGPSMSPDAASLSLSPSWTSNTNTWAEETLDWQYGLEPSYKFGINYIPGVASLELIQSYEWNQFTDTWDTVYGSWTSGPVPEVAVSDPRNPDKGDLTITGYSPAQGIIYSFPIAKGDLTTTGKIPFAGIGTTISPEKGELEILRTTNSWDNVAGTWNNSTSVWGETVINYKWSNYGGNWDDAYSDWEYIPFVPEAVESLPHQPDKGDLTLTGVAPEVTLQTLTYVPTADLTLSTTAPDAPIGPSVEVGTAELTVIQTYDWNNYGGTWANATTTWDEDVFAPRAEETQHDTVPKGDITLSGQVPVASENHHHTIPVAADLSLTGYAPPFGVSHFRSPGKADITGLSSATWENYGGTWAESTDNWGVGTLSPTVGITYTFPIDKGDLELSGYSPIKVNKDPTYLATIIVT